MESNRGNLFEICAPGPSCFLRFLPQSAASAGGATNWFAPLCGIGFGFRLNDGRAVARRRSQNFGHFCCVFGRGRDFCTDALAHVFKLPSLWL